MIAVCKQLALFVLMALLIPSDAGATSGWESKTRDLQAALEEAIERYDIPGAVVGVWTPAGKWLVTEGFAELDKRDPVQRYDRFGIRSITKSFTVTLILQLVAEGRLGLDDKVAKHVADVPNGDKVTIRQLGNMTSGLFDYTQNTDFIDALLADPNRKWTNRELLDYSFAKKPNFDPGTEYQYSNTNTILLGVVVQKVARNRYEDVLRYRITTPLRLNDTRYLYGSEIRPPRALNYLYDDDTESYFYFPFSLTGLGPAGALIADVDDLRWWGKVLVEGYLLPDGLQRQRFEARPATNGPEYDRYGLGMGELDGYWGHTGSGLGFEALVMHHPTRDETAVILVNTSRFEDIPAKIFREFAKILKR